jgi:chaperonin GroES
MDFRPMADRVLVRCAEPETKTASGLFIPDSTEEAANKGTVVAVGPGRSSKDGRVVAVADIAVDDVVMFGAGAGIPVKVNGQDLLVLKEDELIAIVSD